ncbi:MAG: VOC family protein [Candidatus Promineifilaceae bacterium]|nr:VOC family protein [Candidatus Promineifilaceae bacterium]
MAHPIVHIELSATNHAEAAKWYAELFGWQTQEMPETDYSTALPAEDQAGIGFNPISDQQPAGTVTPYIYCEDIRDTLAAIDQHGGEVLVTPMDIPGVGQVALFKDPTGNIMGLLQPTMEQ